MKIGMAIKILAAMLFVLLAGASFLKLKFAKLKLEIPIESVSLKDNYGSAVDVRHEQEIRSYKQGNFAQSQMPSAINDMGAEPSGENHISIQRNPNFNGVAEPKKNIFDLMAQKEAERRKVVVKLEQEDLNKPVAVPQFNAEPVDLSQMTPDEIDNMDKRTLVSAPVKFSLIDNERDFYAFVRANKLAAQKIDFTTHQAVILVSDSDIPNRIFQVAGVEYLDKATVVQYRVNPLELTKTEETYSYIAVKKTKLPVTLKQVR